ncbi:MAG: lipopolysaccharide export LptBFGC system permease protein LptF [Planctomycetota bacterium]|jgi:lipopolysaccharide export LptBFGC system permease protein LptF
MSVLGRHLLRRSTQRTLASLGILWPWILLASIGRTFEHENPLLSVRPGLSFTLGLVISAPFVFSLSSGLACVWYLARTSADHEDLLIEACGLPPRCWWWPPLVSAAILSLACFGLEIGGHSRAIAMSRSLDWLQAEDLAGVLVRLPQKRASSRSAVVAGRPAENESGVRDLRVFSPRPEFVLVAERADLRIDEPGRVEVRAESGEFLATGRRELRIRYAEAAFRLTLTQLTRVAGRRVRKPASRPYWELLRESDSLLRISKLPVAANRYRYEVAQRLFTGALPLLLPLAILLAARCRRGLPAPIATMLSFPLATVIMFIGMSTAKGLSQFSLGVAQVLLWSTPLLAAGACSVLFRVSGRRP